MIHASCSGVVLALIAARVEHRDPGLSETKREAILAAITTDRCGEETTEVEVRYRAANRAVALKAVLSGAETGLTPGERALLSEWLDRISDTVR